jgi:tricarballylate dehydrogenase
VEEGELEVDVLVVGGGNAGLCAALSASERGSSVLVIEKSPKNERGGNTKYTTSFRFSYESIEQLATLCEIDEAGVEIPPYGAALHAADLIAASDGLADPDFASVLARESFEAVTWLAKHGLGWTINRDGAKERDGKLVWQAGYALAPEGLGAGLLRALYGSIARHDISVFYEAALVDLTRDSRGRVSGALVQSPAGLERIRASAVVLAAGGFEASPEKRARYLGAGWDTVKVRGSRFNTGECLDIAIRHGVATAGEWSGCHATMVHASAPPVEMGNESAFPLAYPFGITVNSKGRRFADEGEHYHLRTYAKLGRAVFEQPGRRAYQLFDGKSRHLRAAEGGGELAYAVPHLESNDLRDLGRQAGIDADQLVASVAAFNDAVQPGDFDPARLDGKRTRGLDIEKTNWALPIDTPPFELYPVECGLTFTYGGLRTTLDGQCLNTAEAPIPGLYAVGEMAGTYFGNYAGGSGLTKGTVFGRRAGRHAADAAVEAVEHES